MMHEQKNPPAANWRALKSTQIVQRFNNSRENPKRQDSQRIDFAGINRAALRNAQAICARFFEGHRRGDEFIARNPLRADRQAGSLKISLTKGCWSDFATGDKGGDLINLIAWRFSIKQGEAAKRLASMLGMNGGAHG